MMIGRMIVVENGKFLKLIKRFFITKSRTVCQNQTWINQDRFCQGVALGLQPILVENPDAQGKLIEILFQNHK